MDLRKEYKRLISRYNKLKYKADPEVQECVEQFHLFSKNLIDEIETAQPFLQIINNFEDAIFSITLPEIRFQFINDVAVNLAGYSKKELYSNSEVLFTLVHPAWHKLLREQIEQVIKGIPQKETEYKLITKSGREKWVSVRCVIRKNNRNKPIALDGIVSEITESKEQQIAIEENKFKYQELFDNINNCVIVLRFNKKKNTFEVLDLNKAAELEEGIEKEEVRHKDISKVLPSIKRNGVLKDFFRVTQTGENIHRDSFRFTHFSKVFWREIHIYSLPSGEIIYLYDDITNRKKAEDALVESEHRYKSIYDNAPGVILTISHSGIVTDCNKRVEVLTGFSREELLQKNFLKLFHSAFSQEAESLYHDIITYGHLDQQECILAQKKGNGKIHVLINAIGITNNMGEYSHYMCFLSDITRLKQTEHKIRVESKVNTILSRLSRKALEPEMAFNKIARTVHLASLELTQSDFGFTVYRDRSDQNQKKVIFTHEARTRELLYTEAIRNLKLEILCVENEVALINSKDIIANLVPSKAQIVNLICIPCRVEDEILGHVCIGNNTKSDIDKLLTLLNQLVGVYSFALFRKIYEQRLINTKELALENDKLKSAFIANMSHEMRTPINGILGFTTVLRGNVEEAAKNVYLDNIELSTKRLLNFLGDIFSYAQIESGNLKYSESPFDLLGLMDEMLSWMEMRLSDNGKKHLDKKSMFELGQNTLHFLSDREKLSQSLTHLIDNAVKFTEEGNIEIGCQVNEKAKKILFYVKDSGVGILKAKLPIIFDKFRQEDESFTRKFEGSGLGLAITKELVKLLGGKLKVESQKNKGSIFYFELPLKTQNSKAVPPQNKKHYNFEGKNILVVEDEEVNFTLLQALLKPSKATLHYAKNGKKAIKLVRDNTPMDLVIMDLRLPEMNGFEVTKAIKSINPSIPIIAQTAYALDFQEKKVKEMGFHGFISKPIRAPKLFWMIHSVLEGDDPVF